MFIKGILGIIAIFLTFIAFVPYVRDILLDKVRPHVFSWVIWGIVTFIIFLAQLSDGAGVGAWPIGISGVITFFVAILAYWKKSDDSITLLDWLFFLLALLSIPVWYFMDDVFWALILLVGIDVAGTIPTIRKAYVKPDEEQILLYAIMGVRNLVVCFALENYSVVTVLFPVVATVLCSLIVFVILLRRRVL
jgi:hypothetical protein